MTFTGAGFYDTINKMLIGFLILLPFVSKTFLENGNISSFMFPLLIVGSWLIGIFFWAITKFSKDMLRGCVFISKHSKDSLLQKTYTRLLESKTKYYSLKPSPIDDNIEGFYNKCYYYVQKNGLLGNVPVLESLSEFFFNMVFVLLFWIILICYHSGCQDYCLLGCIKVAMCNFSESQGIIFINSLTAIAIGIILIILSYFTRIRTELQIHKLIFEAYFYSFEPGI